VAHRRSEVRIAMNSDPRPLSVTILAWVYIAAGTIGFIYHFRELLALQRDSFWVEPIRLLAILSGVFMLRGRDWARWLALAWIAFHVVVSAFHPSVSWLPTRILCLDCVGPFHPGAARYFSRVHASDKHRAGCRSVALRFVECPPHSNLNVRYVRHLVGSRFWAYARQELGLRLSAPTMGLRGLEYNETTSQVVVVFSPWFLWRCL